MKKAFSLLIAGILILLAPGCSSRFDKARLLKRCGFSVELRELSPEQELSEIEARDRGSETDSLYRLFSRTHDYSLNLEICRDITSGIFLRGYGTPPDTLLIDHFFACALERAKSPDDVAGLLLSYSERASYDFMLKTAKECLKIPALSDSLRYKACRSAMSASSYLASEDDLSYDEALGYAVKALEIDRRMSAGDTCDRTIRRLYGDLYDCAILDCMVDGKKGWLDSLYRYHKSSGVAYKINCDYPIWHDPLFFRYEMCLQRDESLDYASAILGMLTESLMSDKNPIYEDTYTQSYLVVMFENARLSYLTDASGWQDCLDLARSKGEEYLSGASRTVSAADYLAPRNDFITPITDLLAGYYNHPDPAEVYDEVLFVKGTNSRLTSGILTYVMERADEDLRAYVDSLRLHFREDPWSGRNGFDLIFDEGYNAYCDREKYYGKRLDALVSAGGNDIRVLSKPSYRDVLADLSAKETAVEVLKCLSFEGGYDYYALVLNSGDERPVKVRLCSSSDLVKALSHNDIYSYRKGGLYDLVVNPLLGYVRNADIRFSPSGLLNIVNVAALQGEDGKRLRDSYRIRYCSSTLGKGHDEIDISSVALFGGPSDLPYAAAEIRSIDSLAHLNGIATDRHPASIIHYATHGIYDSPTEKPSKSFASLSNGSLEALDRCGLALPSGNKDLLTGSEIAMMDLTATDLVVLSCCNSGVGDINSNGVSGLQQAFRMAGANSLLVCLKPVEDEATKVFMTEFYKALFAGRSKQAAFDAATDYMIAGGRYSDPKYWAPFILLYQ